MKTAKISNFYHDKPLFGMDIGSDSLKVMQVSETGSNSLRDNQAQVIGYGFTKFDSTAIKDGIIKKPEIIAKASFDLFKKGLIGDITTRRVALSIPAYRTFTRSLSLPKLQSHELREAVELEAEQYISLPLEDLYLDYEIISQTDEDMEIFLAAVPRSIVDSYLQLAQVMGLETVLIEPSLSSSGRLFSMTDSSKEATFIIDFGSRSSDISIFDKHTLVTGTVQGGGTNFTHAIKDSLGVDQQEAAMIKTRYGLGASQKQASIKKALDPTLQEIIKEIRRMTRYHEERYKGKKPIRQLVTLGGGANIPGLSEYLIQELRMAVRHVDPWQYLKHHGLQPPASADRPMYATVAGLSLIQPPEVFS